MEASLDFVGPNEENVEPSWQRGYICFIRYGSLSLEDGLCLVVSDGKVEVEVKLNEEDRRLLKIYAEQASKPKPKWYEKLFTNGIFGMR